MYVPSTRQALSVVFPKWSLEQKETVSVRVGWATYDSSQAFSTRDSSLFLFQGP